MRAGALAGVEVRVHPSWFVVVFLVGCLFAFALFPARYPYLSGTVHLVMGAVETALFFASVLAHELSHALVARARGVRVEGITLFVFGGMTHTRGAFGRPADELAFAAAGPAASLLLAAAFALVWWAGGWAGWSAAVTGMAGLLAVVNAVLAAFNLLPGLPFDGGRMLRALVWRTTGDAARATRIAATAGQTLGLALVALGLIQLVAAYRARDPRTLAAHLAAGIWLLRIGWFVREAARRARSAARAG